jgi:acyl-coenzyme A thioesterase PaaI-like protein
MSSMPADSEDVERPWFPAPPGRLLGRGHPAGEFLEAYDWTVLEHGPGRFRLEAHLLPRLCNARGQLFGGFTPSYVDLVAVRTAHTALSGPYRGLNTVNMRVDYFDPVTDDRFFIESRVVHSRGKTHLVEVVFKDRQGKLLVYSITTLRQQT